MVLQEESVRAYLDQLADRVPAPGGGAAAALHAAQAAALLAMVARYSSGEKFAEHADTIAEVLATADSERKQALLLAADDSAAFSAVAVAYKMPQHTDTEKVERRKAIQQALAGATEPPALIIELAIRLVTLAEALLPVSNRNVITDVAAAVEAARAAAATARVKVEINVTSLNEPAIQRRCREILSRVDDALTRAGAVTAAVRKAIA